MADNIERVIILHFPNREVVEVTLNHMMTKILFLVGVLEA